MYVPICDYLAWPEHDLGDKLENAGANPAFDNLFDAKSFKVRKQEDLYDQPFFAMGEGDNSLVFRFYSTLSALYQHKMGADGLLIEVHTNPEEALSDGEQSLRPHDFRKLMNELKPIAAAIGREI